MANIKIYRDDAAGVVFFENSTVNPLPVNVGVATEVVTEANRIKIVRTDKFIKGTNDYRVLFKRLKYTRIEDKDGNTFATRTDALNYLTATFTQAAAESVNASYLGVWDAGANNPDITALTPANGDWFYVTATGSIDPNGNGTETGSIEYKVDDIVKYVSQSAYTEWQHVPNETVRVDELDSTVDSIVRNSSLTQFDIHVVAHYTGSENLGTAVKPYVSIQQAISASVNGDTILLDGDFTVTASIELPLDKMLHFYGAGETTVGYASFTPLNGNVFHRASGDATKGFQFQDLTFKNAGGYGLQIEEANQVYVIDCTFNTNGWNGTGLSTAAPENGGTLGYDSSQADLLTFGSGSNVSDGGGMKISNTKNVQVIGCTVQSNFRGIKIEDCGIGGNIFVTRNVASGNIESGIYLAASTLKGTQNATVMMNFAGYNANNGLLVVGGINNKFSQNEVTGNWNGGFVSWGAANTTIRDSGFYDNNRSAYNGIGADGDADASILINDSYSYLATHFHLNPAARFITEILGCQIQNTGLGSNVESIGVKLTAGMGNIPDNDVNIIRIDDCGFIAQDYAIDFSACDVTNLRISLGDNTYEGTGQFAVKAPLLGDYAELPYSSHVTDVNAVDIVTDTLRQSITLCEGIGGNVINIYKVNELQSYINGGNKITIIQRGSDRIQLRSLALSEVTINGVAAGNTINAANDNLNAAFQLTLQQYQEAIVTPLLDALTPISGYNSPLVGSLVGDDLSNGGVVQTTDTTTAGDRIFIPSGSITVGTVFGFLVGNTISTTPTLSDWEFSISIDETGSLTFSNNDGSISTDVIQLGTHAGETWDSHIIIDLKANGTTIDFATSNLLTTASILPTDATTYSVEITAGTYNLTFFNNSGSGTIEIPADTEVLEGTAPVGLTYYYIESPDGVFHYPLFTDIAQAQYEDSRVGGPGSGSSYIFPDDLSSQGTWLAPITSYSGSANAAPINGTPAGVTWNEIPNGADADYAPAALSPFTASLDERTALNQQIHPQGAAWTTTIANGPSWITLDGQSNLVGTAPNVEGTTTFNPTASYTIDVTRTNSYGSSTTTVLVEVNNTTLDAPLDGTIHQGIFLTNADYNLDYGTSFVTSTNVDARIRTAPFGENGAVYDLPGTLDDGDSIEWPFTQYLNIGIVSESVDKTGSDIVTRSVFNTNFDLLFSAGLNGSTFTFGRSTDVNPMNVVGWDNNTTRDFPGGPHASTSNASNPKDKFKLYNNAGRIELSYDINDGNGYQLFASSSVLYGTGSDAPTFTVALPNSYTDDQIILPAFTRLVDGAAAPAGFTLTSGSMDTSVLLNSGSVVTLDSLTLSPGQRMIISETWVEANLLPYLPVDTTGVTETLIGVISQSADWSTISHGDFYAAHEWNNTNPNNNTANLYSLTGSLFNSYLDETLVGSTTDAMHSYAVDFSKEGNLSVIRQVNFNPSLTTEPIGGTFTNIKTYTAATASIGTGSLEIGIATTGSARVNLTTSGITIQDCPLPSGQFNVTEDSFSLPLFNGDSGTTLTLNAGQTYKFWLDDSSIESTDTLSFVLVSDDSAYTTGVTTVGTPGTFGAYVEFVVPSDVPPVKFKWVSTGSGTTYITPTIAGSTYVASVTGITLEGPSGNQTGTNLFNDPAVDSDGVVWGWLSIDEQLGAGERLILDNAFLVDLTDAMPNNSGIFIGLKSSSWTSNYRNNSIANATIGGARFAIYKYSTSDIRIFGLVTGATTIGRNYGTNGISSNGVELAIDLTSSGNNIRLLMQSGLNSSDDVNTTPYADWNSSYKVNTGDQGYGLTSIDVMILGDGNVNASGASGAMDSADVDWTGLSEIAVPTASSLTTPWTKALDFSGGSEYVRQVNTSNSYNPMAMGGLSNTVTSFNYTRTVSSSTGRPWAMSMVFRVDGNNSNQHIFNFGDGASSGNDNIYLRLSANRDLFFGWGREGTGYNECQIGTSLSTTNWYGVYVGFTGERLSGTNATAANLANCFDIRLANSGGSWAIGSDLSVSANWTSTGVRMDRSFGGALLTVGGRSGNRNFHGKVASVLVTTLNLNVNMPGATQIEKLITDPQQWITDHKIGTYYREPSNGTNTANFQKDTGNGYTATQVWLMGDGTSDSFSNGIRNDIFKTDQNNTKLTFNSMVSSDIETVSISGLS